MTPEQEAHYAEIKERAEHVDVLRDKANRANEAAKEARQDLKDAQDALDCFILHGLDPQEEFDFNGLAPDEE